MKPFCKRILILSAFDDYSNSLCTGLHNAYALSDLFSSIDSCLLSSSFPTHVSDLSSCFSRKSWMIS
jgi:hypothetical protein